MRTTTTKTSKDQKTSSRASAGEEKDHVHVSSARLRAEQEDKGRRLRTAHATPNREEANFRHACIKRHSGCWPPPKNSMDGVGRQREMSASSPHSCGPAPLLYKDYIHGRSRLQLSSLLGRVWRPLPQEDKRKEDPGAIKGGEATP
jgi:hypothetical protein